ncbi:hypothetical protein [Actinoplanes sp. DH11]|uniref:hypothetical protein n=1 Tax=Actinoplanes sp. DH11 TaxID=2857011 RepID=UPI001E5108A3|nr:hypothetical protein [Actinoplanes sp. DH11]
MPGRTSAQHYWWRDELARLTLRLAQQIAADADIDREAVGDREVALAVLAATHRMRTELDERLTEAAQRAAATGADYAEMGHAAGLTRQGARRRWPDLAKITRAARA